ncbi:MAG TPA: glycosyltransferase family 9 protein [Ignavibacteriaceae bacterium]|nr:glycosyltransferase family 9 protein [Ignavibacteriaceae bacterium]
MRGKILVINLKLIGDLIVSTPAVRSLKKAYPDYNIHFLLRKGFDNVLSGNPDITTFIAYNKDASKLGLLKKLLYEFKFALYLRKQKYDIVVALQPGDRYSIWSYISGAPLRVGVEKQKFSFLFNKHASVLENNISYLDYYLKIAQTAGGIPNSLATAFYITKEASFLANQLLAGVPQSTHCLVIHPGASDRLRCWSTDNFISLAKQIQNLPNVKLIFSFGPAEKDMVEIFKTNFPESVISTETLGIKTVGALIKRSRLCISNDTSIRHISVALGVPVITLMPDDISSYWDFYNDPSKELVVLGKRGIINAEDISRRSLHGIEITFVMKKIREYLKV